MYILLKNTEVINVDNDTDLQNHIDDGWRQLSTIEIKAAGMEGYEQYVSSLNTVVNADGSISFTPPTEASLDEVIADTVRAERNAKLTETDYLMLTDSVLTTEQNAAFVEYRQALRDVTAQAGFPNDVVWPTKPEL